MKKTLALLISVLTIGSLSACNAWHGFGRDVEKAGEAIQRSGNK